MRDYNILTKAFSGSDGVVEKLLGVRLEWPTDENGRPQMKEVPGSEFEVDADLVLLAMGFLHPEQPLLEQLGVERDQRGNAATQDFATSVPGVFAAGDARRGQSLIVWAISEGRQAARAADRYLDRLEAGDEGDEGEDLVAALIGS